MSNASFVPAHPHQIPQPGDRNVYFAHAKGYKCGRCSADLLSYAGQPHRDANGLICEPVKPTPEEPPQVVIPEHIQTIVDQANDPVVPEPVEETPTDVPPETIDNPVWHEV